MTRINDPNLKIRQNAYPQGNAFGYCFMTHRSSGFTLIELMIVVAIIGILASMAINSYQTYVLRAQVSEGINMATAAKPRIVEAFLNRGDAPQDRTEAGMTPNGTDTQGNYVQSIDIVNGRIDIAYGNASSASINARILSMTPYVSADGSILWRCGAADLPAGSVGTMGQGTAGDVATYVPSTVPVQYMPNACKP